jgi:CubicO group peptidase (beta-lactamase class C family)
MLFAVTAGFDVASTSMPMNVPRPGGHQAYEDAARYSRAHRGVSMLVAKDGRVVFEDYRPGHTADEAHPLASGTKSFSCATAIAAVQDKLLTFDEPVSQTITEWRDDPRKSKITIRQLLTLTSGIDPGRIGDIPTYAEAIEAKALHAPGTAFQYGPLPFQVFGELMRRKLARSGEDPRAYLDRRVLRPIGLEVRSWTVGRDGNPQMPAGAHLTAREWAKFGQLILARGRWAGSQILDAGLLSECEQGTRVNPDYGMTFWRPTRFGGTNAAGGSADVGATKLKGAHVPDDLVEAAGKGGQYLYIVPSWNLVIVRQAARYWPLWGSGFDNAEFLAPIFAAGAK